MIERVAVDALLLRTQLPDLPIREGSSLMARVASRGDTHAVLVIAGLPVTAKLPPEVEAGAAVDRAGRRTNPKGIPLGFSRVRVAIRRSVHGRIRACRGSLTGS